MLSDWRIDTLKNSETSEPLILAYIVCEKCDGMSLTLKSISSIILLAYICIVLLSLITPMLVGAVYASQLDNDIRNMLSKPELTKDLLRNMHLHNLKTNN